MNIHHIRVHSRRHCACCVHRRWNHCRCRCYHRWRQHRDDSMANAERVVPPNRFFWFGWDFSVMQQSDTQEPTESNNAQIAGAQKQQQHTEYNRMSTIMESFTKWWPFVFVVVGRMLVIVYGPHYTTSAICLWFWGEGVLKETKTE